VDVQRDWHQFRRDPKVKGGFVIVHEGCVERYDRIHGKPVST
jgi:hypothetical protein